MSDSFFSRCAALMAVSLLASCSSLPVPGPPAVAAASSSRAATAVLSASAAAQGHSWRKQRRVDVSYAGQWNTAATFLQPVLTDPKFRGTSAERYEPGLKRVRQDHSGPSGHKQVIRQGRGITVRFNDRETADPEIKGAAALVSDAYTVFLFGSSWLVENGRDLRLMDDRTLDGKPCRLVAGRLSPGFGPAEEDYFIAWIGTEDKLLKRFQFSLNGLDSTRGADVDVTFGDYWKASDGSLWPAHFIEDIQRPLRLRAHEWRMTSLRLNGKQER